MIPRPADPQGDPLFCESAFLLGAGLTRTRSGKTNPFRGLTPAVRMIRQMFSSFYGFWVLDF